MTCRQSLSSSFMMEMQTSRGSHILANHGKTAKTWSCHQRRLAGKWSTFEAHRLQTIADTQRWAPSFKLRSTSHSHSGVQSCGGTPVALEDQHTGLSSWDQEKAVVRGRNTPSCCTKRQSCWKHVWSSKWFHWTLLWSSRGGRWAFLQVLPQMDASYENVITVTSTHLLASIVRWWNVCSENSVEVQMTILPGFGTLEERHKKAHNGGREQY